MGRILGNADKFTDKQVAETLTMLVAQGVKRGASDIHIEPHERFVLVRYRIDGSLCGIHKLPRASLVTVMAQLKKLADLNEQENHAPQEGTYTIEDEDGSRIGIRLSTMPVFGGEKAVLHLSASHGAPLSLEDLGFWGKGLNVMQHVLTSPAGLVLVAGPKHSGTATTLFSLVSMVHTPLVSTATVETHHKHRLPGVSQTYIGDTSSMSMSNGLKAALKQDPNIIMLSSLPDSETIQQAIQAATKGHLLLAGMHADNSCQAVLRVRAAGDEPFLLVTSLRASVGQRLVRKLCPNCRERYQLSAEEQKELNHTFGITTQSAFKKVHELEMLAAPAIFGDVKQLSTTGLAITHLWRPGERGCESCDRTGYKGRTAIVEVLENTEALHKHLLNRDVNSAAVLQAAAIKDGFVPMALDGLVKALRGHTTVSEVLRAVQPVA